MHLLALSFNAHTTLRLEELAGALAAIAGAALFLGSITPFGPPPAALRRARLAPSGVLFVLAVRYGVRP